MWVHPDATERNITAQFPEIFDKHEFLYFSLPDGRMSNFFDSTQFLDASRKTKDLGKLFSAVQCAVQQGKYKSLQDFLKSNDAKTRLAAASTTDTVAIVLDELIEEYNDKYGMGRQVRGFYQDHLDDDGRSVLLNKIPRPASFKPTQHQDRNGQVRVRVDFLLGLRDELSHAAKYLPLPDASQVRYPKWLLVPLPTKFTHAKYMQQAALLLASTAAYGVAYHIAAEPVVSFFQGVRDAFVVLVILGVGLLALWKFRVIARYMYWR